jgi:hypothetical protein
MRGVLLSLAIVMGVALMAPQPNVPIVGPLGQTVSAAGLGDLQQPNPPDINVDVDVHKGGSAWYTNPLWLAIGGLGVLVLILIVVFAARGSGTTVIKE